MVVKQLDHLNLSVANLKTSADWYRRVFGFERVEGGEIEGQPCEAWEATVKREGVKVDYGGAYRWPHSTAWYVEDPTGYTIEVAQWDTDTVRFDPQPA